MVDFVRAIKRPFTDTKLLIIGTAIILAGLWLNFIPFVGLVAGVFVSFFMTGYYVVCAKTVMKGNYRVPAFDEIGDKLIKGLLVIVISLVYSIPLIIVLLLIGGFAILPNISKITAGNTSALLSMAPALGVATVVFILLLLLFAYVIPSAILRFIDKGFNAAFNFGEVFKKAFTKKYFVTWILMMIYALALAVVGGLLGILLMIPTAFASFISGVTFYTAFGEMYTEK